MEGRPARVLVLGDECRPDGHDRAEPLAGRASADRRFGPTRLLVLAQQRVSRPGRDADPAVASRAGRHTVRNRRDRLRGVRLWLGLWILPRGETPADDWGRQTGRSRCGDRRLTRQTAMSSSPKTAIVTGASQGIGSGVVNAFAQRGFNVVATARKMTESQEVAASSQVA